MRAKSLVVMVLSVVLSACASAPKKATSANSADNTIVGSYDFVSVDLSICGRVGTIPVGGEARFDKNGRVFFDMILGEERGKESGYFSVDNDVITVKMSGGKARGNFLFDQRDDGVYLVISFKQSPEEIEEMKKYPQYYSKEYIEKSEKGFEWIFRRK